MKKSTREILNTKDMHTVSIGVSRRRRDLTGMVKGGLTSRRERSSSSEEGGSISFSPASRIWFSISFSESDITPPSLLSLCLSNNQISTNPKMRSRIKLWNYEKITLGFSPLLSFSVFFFFLSLPETKIKIKESREPSSAVKKKIIYINLLKTIYKYFIY